MDITPISNNYFVAAQIAVADVAELKRAGFVTIICNRPDGEDDEQPTFSEIAAACAAEKIDCHHVPVSGMPLAVDAVERHRQAVEESDGKILAYCRSGQRSAVIFAASA